ncbi:sensor histidine kinase [Scatolibacter rhodanostii]|uniref:sensor histidine kinase n=1 Tax=Scatolibacter rhodanostii TaxID=2014781 RepID=UPI000C089AFD|nr:ATP-binding protein [Scatolibacter rhodanostii]
MKTKKKIIKLTGDDGPTAVFLSTQARPHRFKIRTQLLLGFLAFTIIIGILLWVFQILFLNTFYSNIKKAEVRSAAEKIAANLDNDNLDDILRELVLTKDINLLVANSRGKRLYGYSTSADFLTNYIESYNAYDLMHIFNLARSDNGQVMQTYERTLTGDDRNGIIWASTPKDSEGNDYLILLEVQITPVDATVDTLKIQLFCVTIVMILLGSTLAVWISSRLTKPIESINQGAKQMAGGDYATHFTEIGSRETCELAETLNYTAGELSKVEALRHELLANVSHDLRTPLTMIQGYSEVMRDLPGENTPENVQIIIDEAARLNALVNDLLDLSRLEAGANPLHLTTFNITQSVRETLKRYEKLSDFIFVFTPDEDLFVHADELKISQVLYNLINNAIHYSRNEKMITILQEHLPENKVRISVVDKGEGIPADKLKDIWERYFKIDKEHRQSQTGTGIGLSIVKNILSLHGGDYGVNSLDGIGSTFWFELSLSNIDEQII